MDTPTNIISMERQRLHIAGVADAPIERPSLAAERLEKALTATDPLPLFAAKALLCIQDSVIDSTADLESDVLAALWQSLDDPKEAGWARASLRRIRLTGPMNTIIRLCWR